jgi:hypothetical protein
MRSTWTDLPNEVRDTIQRRTGEVTGLDPAPAGNHADVAATLPSATGRTFVKASRKLVGGTAPRSGRCAMSLLVTSDGQVRVVDWAFAARGAAWVELGLLIPWLLKAGHTPAETAEWVARFPSWTAADSAHIDQFSEAFAARWAQHAASPALEDWVTLPADLTRRWAEYRTGRSS